MKLDERMSVIPLRLEPHCDPPENLPVLAGAHGGTPTASRDSARLCQSSPAVTAII